MSGLFLTILNMSLTANYVIICVILIRLLLKKAPKVIPYALWSVVAFRLIIPFSFESMFSLMPRNTNAVSIPLDIMYQQSPQINSGIEAVDSFISESLPAPTIGASVNPMQIYIEIGAYIWVLGTLVLLIYSLISILILKRQLKSAELIEQNIYEAKNLKTPFVLGLIRQKIYLPVGLNVEERGYILLHEQTHIHRKDHIIKLLAFLILSIHWFNPLVWIAFMLMSTDMELSCDEQVLKVMNEDIKKPYANSLLSLATGRHILNGSPLAFGEGNVKKRIKNVLNYKKPRFWVVIASAIVLIGAGITLLSNPVRGEQRELIYYGDVDGNGQDESIFIDKSQIDNMFVTLSICNRSGKEIWSERLSTSHAGWGSLFLCKLDGKHYILRYNPYISQGYATYMYTLFTLEAEKAFRINTLEFDINGIARLNPSEMIAFADEVNDLLSKSVLLLSTEGGEYHFGPTQAEPFFERYSWLNLTPELYENNDDLETRLVKYSEYAVSSHKLNEEQYSPNQSDSVQNSKSDEVMETLKSDDDKTIITVYTYTESGHGDNRKIDKIVVKDENGSFEINDVIGYYGTMRWALGQSKAVIEYYGRQWRDFIIIDAGKKEVLFKDAFTFREFMDYFEKQGVVFNYNVNKNRPDIEFRLDQMIDEDSIRINYIVHEENYEVVQSGSFNYSLSKGTFSELTQNEPKVEG